MRSTKGARSEADNLNSEADAGGSLVPTTRKDLLLTLPFIVLFWVQLIHHQLWRDELNAFGIAVASPNLRTLFHYVHYEGHPWLWYLLLWGGSRFTVYPWGMKVLEALIGTTSYLVLGLVSPFNRAEKVLLFLSYYVCFEYTVMSRMYGIILLLTFLYLSNRSRLRFVRGNAVLLGLLASTDVTGMVLSAAFALELIWSAEQDRRRSITDGNTAREQKKKLLQAAAIYSVLVAMSIASVFPSRHISTRTTGRPFAEAHSGSHLLSIVKDYVVVPYFPTATGSKTNFWDALATDHWRAFGILIPFVLLAYWLTFRRHGNLLLMVGLTLFPMIAFGHLVYMGAVRHFGVAFLAYLAGLWIMKSDGEKLPWPAYVLIGLTVVAGIDAEVETWLRPFSNAGATAKWLERHEQGALPWVGTPDTSVAGVAEYAHRPIYMLDCSCSDTFLLFSRRRDVFLPTQIPARLLIAHQDLGEPDFIYIGIIPFTAGQEMQLRAEGLRWMELASFTGADNRDEDFYVYQLSYPGNARNR